MHYEYASIWLNLAQIITITHREDVNHNEHWHLRIEIEFTKYQIEF